MYIVKVTCSKCGRASTYTSDTTDRTCIFCTDVNGKPRGAPRTKERPQGRIHRPTSDGRLREDEM